MLAAGPHQYEDNVVVLGTPRRYPKEKPEKVGRYLVHVVDGTEDWENGWREDRWNIEPELGGIPEDTYFDLELIDLTITHWLPMPPAIRKSE
jgi:hypothetical protein